MVVFVREGFDVKSCFKELFNLKYMKMRLKNYLYFLLAMIIPFGFIACSDDDDDPVVLSGANAIEEFKIESLDLIGKVNKEEATVTIDISASFELEKLKNVKPTITISKHAKISPSASDAQDFSDLEKPVVYTVTAQNDEAKKWTIKIVQSAYLDKGAFGFSEKPLWVSEYLKESPETEHKVRSIAYYENKLYTTVSDFVLDVKSGKPIKGESLTFPGNHDNEVWFLCNDDKGNLLAGPYSKPGEGKWDSNIPYKLLRWKSPKANPVPVFTYEAKEPDHLGRKLNVSGDIDGKAIVSAYNKAEQQYVWYINGGQVKDVEPQRITVPFSGGTNGGDVLIPIKLDNALPAYFSGSANPNFVSVDKTKQPRIPGLVTIFDGKKHKQLAGPVGSIATDIVGSAGHNAPFDFEAKKGGTNNWGSRVAAMTKFTFNEVVYLAVLHIGYMEEGKQDKNDIYVTLFDTEQNKPISTHQFAQDGVLGTLNGNSTYDLAVSFDKDKEGSELKSMKLYVLMTNIQIRCLEITNQVK